MDVMDMRRGLMASVTGGGKLDLLTTLTFERADGRAGRQTVSFANWPNYDFVLFVPNLVIESQEGQTSGNWIWYEIDDGIGKSSNYDGQGIVGARDIAFTAMLQRGKHINPEEAWLLSCVYGGRGARLVSDAPLSDISVTYGGLYGGTYGLISGTVKIYGGKYP